MSLWKRVIRKVKRVTRGFVARRHILSGGKNVNVMGKVYLECPAIVLGDNVDLYPNVHIFGPGEVLIGDNVRIGDGVVIFSGKSVVIKQNTIIAAQSYIIDSNHGMHVGELIKDQPLSSRPVVIEEDCWLGCGVKVLAGAHIGTGSVIGANEVVRGEIPDMNIVHSPSMPTMAQRR